MTEFLKKAPFLKFIILLSAGIIFRLFFFKIDINILVLFSITVIIWIGLIILAKFYLKIKHQWIWGIGVAVSLFLLGYILCCLQLEKFNNQNFPENKKLWLKGTIEDTPQECAKTYKYVLNIELYEYDNVVYKINNKILLYLSKDSISGNLKKGDIITAIGRFLKLKSASGGKFDYAEYMQRRGILYSVFIAKNKWVKADISNISFIERLGEFCKDKVLAIFKKAGLEGRNFSVVSALTIGYKADLDKETRQAYISSGTMHILAVSGLHVGIIYLLLNFILSFLDGIKFGGTFKSVLIITLVGFYAFVTGLSPSILRAALMLYMICFSKLFNRSSFIYNALAISAFLIVLYNPVQITDVGFQLSYVAVLSIVVFYPFIYKLLSFKFNVIDKIWQLAAVSIAAQIGTFPLSLYYFNQFPSFFLLSNLLIIPVSTFAMYLAFILISTTSIPILFNISGKILYYLVDLQNNLVIWIEHLPYSSIKGISFSFIDVFITYLLIISLFLFLIKKHPLYLYLVLTEILIWQWIGVLVV
jgi:competence protein ComEC